MAQPQRQGNIPGTPGTTAVGGSEATLQGVLSRYESEGFAGQFRASRAGKVECLECKRTSRPSRTTLFALHRLEGASDPADMMAVAALECAKCAARGTLVLTYGSMAPPEDASVLQHLMDLRGATGIRPGL